MEGNYKERKMTKSQMNHLITTKWAYIASVPEPQTIPQMTISIYKTNRLENTIS